MLIHPFEPVYDRDCTALVLGTMPSPVSRERGFYYGHPRNRFWPVLAAVFNEAFPDSTEDKKRFVLNHHIALWDVLASCEIEGASDSKIKNPRCNDFSALLCRSKIRRVYTTGQKAYMLYTKFCSGKTGILAKPLPSTSPANCRTGFEELLEQYAVLRDDFEQAAAFT
ncbi:MAG: DNA-deoxyinosine glycosylase [Spirochaetaceae bacterium]|jgi:hypoxanthine-DNA glycosylase|nr:DNA-deoxyinosine glycosylase [Spirochaetaceae bacterium]